MTFCQTVSGLVIVVVCTASLAACGTPKDVVIDERLSPNGTLRASSVLRVQRGFGGDQALVFLSSPTGKAVLVFKGSCPRSIERNPSIEWVSDEHLRIICDGHGSSGCTDQQLEIGAQRVRVESRCVDTLSK